MSKNRPHDRDLNDYRDPFAISFGCEEIGGGYPEEHPQPGQVPPAETDTVSAIYHGPEDEGNTMAVFFLFTLIVFSMVAFAALVHKLTH